MSEKTNTAENPTLTEPDDIACCICLAEIPDSVASSSEADAYTQHFCGIECYAKWHNEPERTEES